MTLRSFIYMIAAMIRRLMLHWSEYHKESFINLSEILISWQDGKPRPVSADSILDGHRQHLNIYARNLLRAREVNGGRSKGQPRVPLGCRLGKLHFAPLPQLAKLLGDRSVEGLGFPALSRTSKELLGHFLHLIGCHKHSASEPAAFRKLFGFKLADYVQFLVDLRRRDPAAFVMLLAHEFRLARGRLRDDPAALAWIERGAVIAELNRLMEIVDFLSNRPATVKDLQRALRIAVRKGGPRNAQERRILAMVGSLVDQLGYSVEALRALFLGDRGGCPIISTVSWDAVTQEQAIKAAFRCAWFARQHSLAIPGFSTAPKRHLRGRQRSAYSYYGITLDMLLVIGVADLATAFRGSAPQGPVEDFCKDFASGRLVAANRHFSLGSHRDVTTATVYAEVYQRSSDRGWGSARFDYRYWLEEPKADRALFRRLWRQVIGDEPASSGGVARQKLRWSLAILTSLPQPLQQLFGPFDSEFAGRVLSELVCGLTPIAMDPIHCALVERALVERGFTTLMRRDPARGLSPAAQAALAARYRSRIVHRVYPHFEDLTGRKNFTPKTRRTVPLAITRTLPTPLRPVATSSPRPMSPSP